MYALSSGAKSFSELVKLTGLSERWLSVKLKQLLQLGIVKLGDKGIRLESGAVVGLNSFTPPKKNGYKGFKAIVTLIGFPPPKHLMPNAIMEYILGQQEI